MTHEQAVTILKTVKTFFQTFQVDEAKVRMWARKLQKYDYNRIMTRLENWVDNHREPPTFHDLTTDKDERAFLPQDRDLKYIEEQKRQADELVKRIEDRDGYLTLSKGDLRIGGDQ